MYERVLIVGVEYVADEPGEAGVAGGRVRVQCVNEKGKSRVILYELVKREGGWTGAHAAGYRASGSMSRLLAAAGIQQDEHYEEMLVALAEGDVDRAMRAEGRVETRVMEVLRAVGGMPGEAEKDVGADLVSLLVGRMVRIDWIQMGPYGRLGDHPANVLPARGNGGRMFGKKAVARVVAEWEAAVRRQQEPPDLRALDAVANEIDALLTSDGEGPSPGHVRL